MGIFWLFQIKSDDPQSSFGWINVDQLQLQCPLAVEWTKYIKGLRHVGITLQDTEEVLAWIMDTKIEEINANTSYSAILSCYIKHETHWWHKMWAWYFPLKIKMFILSCVRWLSRSFVILRSFWFHKKLRHYAL